MSWGSWIFDPEFGIDLKPQDGPVTINVEVVAPSVPQTEFKEKIKIYNPEDVGDYCEIDVVLNTQRNRALNTHLSIFQNKHLQIFTFLQMLLHLLIK